MSKASAASPAKRYRLVGVPSPWRTTGWRLWSSKLNLGIISVLVLAIEAFEAQDALLTLRVLVGAVDVVASHNDNWQLE